jgi:outer membrane protein assembly factor BamB
MLLTSLIALSLAPCATGSDWPQFRGPSGLSVADDTPIPTRFGPDENVRWKVAVPAGQSSPCIVAGSIFVTGYEDGKNVALAVDRASGEVLWRKTFEGSGEHTYFHVDAAPGSPSPASDGERVVFYFGDFGLVATDLAGETLWETRLPHPGYAFGVGSSPLLFEGLLIVPRDGAPEAALLVLDAEDGSELWRVDRFGYGESHGTPFLWRNADRTELVVSGSNRLCSFDLVSGKQLWAVEGLTSFPCTTPTADRDTLYFAAWSTGNATGRSFWEAGFTRSLQLSDEEVADPAKLFARLDANGDGKVEVSEVPECRLKDAFSFVDSNQSGAWEVEEFTQPPSGSPGRNLMVAVARGAEGEVAEEHIRWSWTRGLPYVASPLLYRGRIWLFKSGGLVTCLDAATGEPILDRARLSDRSEYYVSPVGAAGRVLVGTAEGTLYVLDAEADELTVTHSVEFDDELFATPAVLDGTVYLRSKTALWAFGAGIGD